MLLHHLAFNITFFEFSQMGCWCLHSNIRSGVSILEYSKNSNVPSISRFIAL